MCTHTLSCWTLLCRPSVVRLPSLDCSWSCADCSHLRREPERPRNCTSCRSQAWMAASLREAQKREERKKSRRWNGATRKDNYKRKRKETSEERSQDAVCIIFWLFFPPPSSMKTHLPVSIYVPPWVMYEKCWLPVDKTDLMNPLAWRSIIIMLLFSTQCDLKVGAIWDRAHNTLCS